MSDALPSQTFDPRVKFYCSDESLIRALDELAHIERKSRSELLVDAARSYALKRTHKFTKAGVKIPAVLVKR